jgi:hypothetical protein
MAHEHVGLVTDGMLANRFDDDSCPAGSDGRVGIWHC